MHRGESVKVQEFFDQQTGTLTYIIHSQSNAIVIDPVWNFNAENLALSNQSADALIQFLETRELKLDWILETHAHADHLSSSQILKRRFPNAKIGVGKRIQEVQKVFKEICGFPASFSCDGSQFDFLIENEEVLAAGDFQIEAIATPGHTPACLSFLIEDMVFSGDTLFLPDSGTGRCDFPGGSAASLYDSIQRLYALPKHYRVFVGHDYQPGGRILAFCSSIEDQRSINIHLQAHTIREDFIRFREERDRTLKAPKLLLPSLKVNLNAGRSTYLEKSF